MKKMNQVDLCQFGPRVLRYVVSLGCAALLAACGGGDTDYLLSVQVSGLNQQAIVLKSTLGTGQEDRYMVTKEGIQQFHISISRGGSYSVTVADSGSLVCDVKNGAASNVTSTPPPVIVTCSGGDGSSFSVGGTVTGLTTGQAFTVRLNPDATPFYFSKNGSYQFPTLLARGAGYNVQIVTQTHGLFCRPVNGVGTIANANATVDIGCKTIEKAWPIHAQVTGLADGNALALHNQQPGHADEVRLFTKDGTQTFEQPVPDQGEYLVFIGPESQLNGQLCSVVNGNSSGNARSNVTVQIQCAYPPPTSFRISVKVTGLYDGNQLVVQNQTSTELMTLTSASTQGTFNQANAIGQPYSVQITTLPTLQACRLINGSGPVNGPVTVNVSCGEPAITTVYSTPPLDGGDAPYYGYPVGLVKGIDGYFYGVTTRADIFWLDIDRKSRAGSVFKMDLNNPGALQTIAGFQGSSCTGNLKGGEVGTGGVLPPSPTGIIQTQAGQLLGTTFGGAQPLVTNNGPFPDYSYECSGENYRTGNLRFRGTVFSYANDQLNQFFYQIGRQDQATAIQNAGPVSGLIQDQDGNVYGITYGKVFAGATAESTTQSAGTVFKWTRDGQWVPLYVFNPDSTANPIWNATFRNGFYPSGKLMLDGNYLYGTTERGGAGGDGSGAVDAGTVFRIDLTKSDPKAAFEVVYHFDSTQAPYVRPARYYLNATEGYFFTDPYASRYSGLTKGGDGHLYGVRRDGGANGAGAIYRLVANLSGAFAYEQLYSFPASRGTPLLELIEINGVFYGTTLVGGDNGMGSLYRFNPETGNFVTIHSFKGTTDKSDDGQTPGTALIAGDDGKSLYGATTRGGAHDQGAIYKLSW